MMNTQFIVLLSIKTTPWMIFWIVQLIVLEENLWEDTSSEDTDTNAKDSDDSNDSDDTANDNAAPDAIMSPKDSHHSQTIRTANSKITPAEMMLTLVFMVPEKLPMGICLMVH